MLFRNPWTASWNLAIFSLLVYKVDLPFFWEFSLLPSYSGRATVDVVAILNLLSWLYVACVIAMLMILYTFDSEARFDENFNDEILD